MGNYAQLFTSDDETPNYEIKEDCIALQAKYRIPVFWVALFTPESFRYVTPITKWAPEPDDEPEPFCSIELSKALTLFKQRKPLIFQIVPKAWEQFSDAFVNFLRSKNLKYIHLSQSDLAYMGSRDLSDWEVEMKKLLTSIDENPCIKPEGFMAKYRKPRLSPGWKHILGTAGTEQKKLDAITPWDLAGGGEGMDAPWDGER